jgi:site-specific DNA-methyltransferase (adenine-specific)
MNGLKEVIEDDEERYKIIVEECLYYSDINKQNIFIANLLLDPYNKYKLNSNEGDTLKLDIKKKWMIEGFDLVIGNPPYNEELKESGGKPLYNVFIDFVLPNTKLLSFIIPSRWFSGGKGLDKFRERMLKRKDIVYINHIEDAKKIFGSIVDIKGGVNYFLIDKSYNGLCNYNGDLLNLDEHDIIVENKYKSIIKKMEDYEKITILYKGQGYYNIKTNDKRLFNNFNDNSLKCYVSQQNGFIKYINKEEINKKFNNYKVITARASHKGNSGFGNIFIGIPNEICNQSYISFNVNNEIEAKSLLSYLKCKLPNFILSLRKISQDISEHTLKWIPLVPLDREWTNDEIYNYLKLDENEITLIKNIKIIGFND